MIAVRGAKREGGTERMHGACGEACILGLHVLSTEFCVPITGNDARHA